MKRLAAAMWLVVALAGPARADVKAGVAAWTRKDYARAVAEWRGPAASGDADAQYNLGQAYRRGLGVPADPVQAEAWYRKAAQRGHAEAQASLALMLFQSPARADAFPWLEQASAKGEPRAQYVLATALFNGDGITKDWPRAYALMRRAAASGLAAAGTSLTEMETYLSPADKRQGETIARTLTGGRTASRAAAATPPPQPPKRSVATAAPPAVGGGWRVQLGAFGRMDAARAHWAKLAARPALAALTPRYVQGGGVVRVQAGPLANRAAAGRACATATAAGSACFTIEP